MNTACKNMRLVKEKVKNEKSARLVEAYENYQKNKRKSNRIILGFAGALAFGVAITGINDTIFNKRLENLVLPSESPGVIIDEYDPSKGKEFPEEYNELSEKLSNLLGISKYIKPEYWDQYPVEHTNI